MNPERLERVKRMKESGMSFSEIGRALKISRQRAHQLYQDAVLD